MSGDFVVEGDDRHLCVKLPREIRFSSQRRLRKLILDSYQDHEIVIDCSKLQRMPIWFVGMLLHLEERGVASASTLTLTHCNRAVIELLLVADAARFVRDVARAEPILAEMTQ